MITSKAWEQLFPGEAWHKGQRWYCRDNPWNQEHRYYAKYGVIVEIRRGGTIYYMRAEVPDKQKLDIPAMSYEKKFGGTSPRRSSTKRSRLCIHLSPRLCPPTRQRRASTSSGLPQT